MALTTFDSSDVVVGANRRSATLESLPGGLAVEKRRLCVLETEQTVKPVVREFAYGPLSGHACGGAGFRKHLTEAACLRPASRGGPALALLDRTPFNGVTTQARYRKTVVA